MHANEVPMHQDPAGLFLSEEPPEPALQEEGIVGGKKEGDGLPSRQSCQLPRKAFLSGEGEAAGLARQQALPDPPAEGRGSPAEMDKDLRG